MWNINTKYTSPEAYFSSLRGELNALIIGEANLIANLANISSWIYHSYPDLNWCGFYLWSDADQELILGPFQGKPACLRVKSGKGVCGTSFSKRSPIRVDDVSQFPDHISCDSATQSELVIPLIHHNKVRGVLDLDSPIKQRFSAEDEDGFCDILSSLVPKIF